MFRNRCFLFLILSAALLLSWMCSLASAQAPEAELRGLWVDAWHSGYRSPAEIAALVNVCKTHHFNAVFPQMRKRGDAFYLPQKPNREPRAVQIPPDFDALQELIRQCHAADPRIEVHCWVTTFLVWGDGKNRPPQPGHIFNKHPEFLMRNSGGEKHLSEGFYADPGHPGANQWLYDMATDIVARYDVDGFHWDYVRYPQADSGYNPTAIARYNAEFGLTGQPAPSDPRFSKWRRRQITDFLRWVNADLLAVKPRLTVSCSVFGSRTDALNARFQDWGDWCREGIIDLCCPMNYTPDMGLFKSRCDDAFLHRGIRQIGMGTGAYMNTRQGTLEQFLYARQKQFAGVLLYSYAAPSKSESQTDTFGHLREKFQPSWVPAPVFPWKAAPSNGLLKGTVSHAGQPVYNAAVSVDGAGRRSQLTEPHGKFAFFELPPGVYTLSAVFQETNRAVRPVVLNAGQILNLDLEMATAATVLAVKTDTVPASSPATARIEPPAVQPPPQSETHAAAVEVSIPPPTASSIVSNPAPVFQAAEPSVPPVVAAAPGVPVPDAVRAAEPPAAKTEPVPPIPVPDAKTAVKSLSAPAVPAHLQDLTDPDGPVPEIILDNAEAEVVGDWTRGAVVQDKYGKDYHFLSNRGMGGRYVTYAPSIPHRGVYELFEWHSQGENRVADAPVTINHLRGSDTVFVNQRINGGRWNSIGKYLFDVGKIGTVVVADYYNVGHVIVADAFKWVYVPRNALPSGPSVPQPGK